VKKLSRLQEILVKKSGLAHSDGTPPLRELVTLCLSSLHPSQLFSEYFPPIYTSLLLELSLAPQRLSAYAAGLSLIPTRTTDLAGPQVFLQFAHIEHCLVLIDSFLLGQWSTASDLITECDDVINGKNQDTFCSVLIALCAASHIMLKTVQDDDLVAVGMYAYVKALPYTEDIRF
jgi:hypothetical protein